MPKSSAKLSIGFLFDDTLDSNDGVAQYVKTLGSWLSSQGHEVSYLVGETKMREWAGGQVYSLAHNLKVSFNGNRLSIPLPAARRPIKDLMTKQHFDVIHVQVPYSPFMAQKVIKRSSDRTAVVGTFHIYPSGWLSRAGSHLLRIMYGSSLQRVRPMLAVSPAAADFAASAYKLKTQISPNVIDIQRFQAAKPNRTHKPKIVFLGRLVDRKGSMQLLKAFRLLHQRLPEVSLQIAGAGPLRRDLEKYVTKHSLEKVVSFSGYVNEEAKPALLASADVACFPSLYGESFGIVLIEAMAAGAGVVIGGDNPGYRSVLRAQPKLLVRPQDAQGLADRLEGLLTDKKLAMRLHAWQTEEVERYDVAKVGLELLEIYRAAIANRR